MKENLIRWLIMCVIHKLVRTIYSMLINKTHFIPPKEDLGQNSS